MSLKISYFYRDGSNYKTPGFRFVLAGELTEEEGLELHDKLISAGQTAKDGGLPSEAELERILREKGVPTQDELQQLSERLDELVAKLDDIGPESGAS